MRTFYFAINSDKNPNFCCRSCCSSNRIIFCAGLKNHIRQYIHRLSQYNFLWKDDMQKSYSKFMASDPDMATIRKEACYLVFWVKFVLRGDMVCKLRVEKKHSYLLMFMGRDTWNYHVKALVETGYLKVLSNRCIGFTCLPIQIPLTNVLRKIGFVYILCFKHIRFALSLVVTCHTIQVEHLLEVEKKISSIPPELPAGSVILLPAPTRDALQGLAAAWKTQYAMVC